MRHLQLPTRLRRPSRQISWGIVVLAALVVGLTTGLYAVTQQRAGTAGAAKPHPNSRGANTGYGLPGINPNPTFLHQGAPAFSEADVRAWYAANPGAAFATVDEKTPTIQAIKFMTAAEVGATIQYGEYDRAPTDLQCVLILHGNFDAVHLPTAPGSLATVTPRPGAITVIHLEVIVFDAQTGNILSMGLQNDLG